jgi:excinuclease ABC subunit B
MKEYTLPKNYNGVIEQLIRPTGLLDPIIDVRPTLSIKNDELKKSLRESGYNEMSPLKKDFSPVNQIDDLLEEIRKTVANGQRILVTTLTKRMAEELTNFLLELNIKVQYLHSDIDTIERVEILRDLRLGKYDVVVGINLLREGLDLPEVSLVAILDADKEGFLRSNTSLVQTIGRAARHSEGHVIMYADKITKSMKYAIDETYRRRKAQNEYNEKHGITPTTISKEIKDHVIRLTEKNEDRAEDKTTEGLLKQVESYKILPKKDQKKLKAEIELQMKILADMLEFEKAAKLRDILDDLKS